MTTLKPKILPSQSEIEKYLSYDSDSGFLNWKTRSIEDFYHCKNPEKICNSWNTQNAKQLAFTSVLPNGYKQGSFLGKMYLAHRIIYKLMTNLEPEFIDHKDGNKQNNSWKNLRSVSCLENMRNRKKNSNNTSGIMGVYWNEASSRWQASIDDQGYKIYLGVFEVFEDAVLARKQKEIELGFHPNHGREQIEQHLKEGL